MTAQHALTQPQPKPEEIAAYNAVMDMDIFCQLIQSDAEHAAEQFRVAYQAEESTQRASALAEARLRCKRIDEGLRTIGAAGYLDAESSPLMALQVAK